MHRTISPLRYPGGKTCLFSLASQIIRLNRVELGHYYEPFAGGGGLALSLLYEGHISDIHINDLDPSIWSFWKCVLDHTDEFVEKIRSTEISIEEWKYQRDIHARMNVDNVLSLGFSTFFLNRTNRSGIIKGAGVIGGKEQSGDYKIDCRFNKDDLIRRIRRIEKYRNRIHLYNLDAQYFLKHNDAIQNKSIFFIDPPYYNKGSKLYTNFYKHDDHSDLCDTISQMRSKWVLTYDNVEKIRSLYKGFRKYEFDINYSIETKRVGTEILIPSKRLRLPPGAASRRIRTTKAETQTSDLASSENFMLS